jgi:hypothetical protein
MIGWSIVVFVLLVLGVFGIVLAKKNWDFDWAELVGVILLCGAGVILLVVILQPIFISQEITVFNQQSIYIENHQAVDPIENAALTNKKIELNNWLFESQWSKNKFGAFSFYPASILELEPIQ